MLIVLYLFSSGLSFGHLPDAQSDMQTPFLSLFAEKNPETLVFLDVLDLLHAQANVDKDSEIVRKLGVLYLIYNLVFARESGSYINHRIVILADQPAEFNAFPWGRKIYDEIVKEMTGLFYKTVNAEEGTETYLKIAVFPFALQCWFFEGLEPNQYNVLAEKCDDTARPRFFRWLVKKRPDYSAAKNILFNHDEVNLNMLVVLSNV